MGSFDFVFFTDTHIQPELRAEEGCAACFAAIRRLRPAFALAGGDMVFDSAAVPRARTLQLFDLYRRTEDTLQLPVHRTLGNHDVVGLQPRSGVAADDPIQGKRLFRQLYGETYYAFDHQGCHFVVLDSIHLAPTELGWEARIDETQLQWLARDLEAVGPVRPIIVTSHVPLVTGYLSYVPDRSPARFPYHIVVNAREVLRLFEGRNVLAVLQGHTHINEVVTYNGCQFITSGAVSGEWWKGPRFGRHPEGFTVISVREGELSHRYETYGFVADQRIAPARS